MQGMHIAEADWKIFKKVRAKALDRFSQRVLDEFRAICNDTSMTAHERYLKLYKHIHTRDREMAGMFDDYRRSTALLCLALMRKHEPVEDNDLSPFSRQTPDAIRIRD